MAERSNAAVLKTVDPKGPGVRIPLSPLEHCSKSIKSLQTQWWQGFFILGNPQIIQKLSKKMV
jgi:hypothetical protein